MPTPPRYAIWKRSGSPQGSNKLTSSSKCARAHGSHICATSRIGKAFRWSYIPAQSRSHGSRREQRRFIPNRPRLHFPRGWRQLPLYDDDPDGRGPCKLSLRNTREKVDGNQLRNQIIKPSMLGEAIPKSLGTMPVFMCWDTGHSLHMQMIVATGLFLGVILSKN